VGVMKYLITLALVMFLPVPAIADITGQARVIDGDTLEVLDQRIRPRPGETPALPQGW